MSPFQSEKQKTWMKMNKPKMYKEWMSETGRVKGMNNHRKRIDKAARDKGF